MTLLPGILCAPLANTFAADVALSTIDRHLSPVSPAIKLHGRLKQGLMRMVLGQELSVEDCCRIAVSLGATGLDFFSLPADWEVMRRYGLKCSMFRLDHGGVAPAVGRRAIEPPGWNAIGSPAARGDFLQALHGAIDQAADNDIPNIILLCGTRLGLTYEQGATNAIAFCNEVKGHAEQRGVTLCMENINSTGFGGPPLSLFDHAQWGFNVCRQVNSPRIKVLYDIFHAQIMDGNLIKTIRDNFELIGHFHVGGVPGRHEIDQTQEINFRAVAQVIAELGFKGFISHEWMPSPGVDPLNAIRRSMAILDVE